ncbi:MAG: hypothetical protein KGN40_09295 [Burkholderiales bacterium]|nr:hypothetical protein [Burkholderiales bacterium]
MSMGEIAIDNQKYFSGGSINTTFSGGSTNTTFSGGSGFESAESLPGCVRNVLLKMLHKCNKTA